MKFHFVALVRTVVLLLAPVLSAHGALMLGPGDATATSDENKNYSTWAKIETGYGIDIANDLELLYKAEVGDATDPTTTEKGPLSGSYETSFFNTPLDPSDALIKWVTGTLPAICNGAGSESCYLVVKDGNQKPSQYLFDISDWNGMTDIQLTGFWPAQGAISKSQVL